MRNELEIEHSAWGDYNNYRTMRLSVERLPNWADLSDEEKEPYMAKARQTFAYLQFRRDIARLTPPKRGWLGWRLEWLAFTTNLKSWWITLKCRYSHPVIYTGKGFWDRVAGKTVNEYYCPVCDSTFQAHSQRDSFRVYQKTEGRV